MVTEGNREISFVIEKRLGVLSTSANGWRKELNYVSWNGNSPKLDIREWSPDHTHMAKGITLRYEEARLLQRGLYRWLTGYGKQPEGGETDNSAAESALVETEALPFDVQEACPPQEPSEETLMEFCSPQDTCLREEFAEELAEPEEGKES